MSQSALRLGTALKLVGTRWKVRTLFIDEEKGDARCEVRGSSSDKKSPPSGLLWWQSATSSSSRQRGSIRMSDIADVSNIPDRTFVSFEVITAQGANHVFRMMEDHKMENGDVDFGSWPSVIRQAIKRFKAFDVDGEAIAEKKNKGGQELALLRCENALLDRISSADTVGLGGDVEVEASLDALIVDLAKLKVQLHHLRSSHGDERALNEFLMEFVESEWQEERYRMVEGYKEAMTLRDSAIHSSQCFQKQAQKLEMQIEGLRSDNEALKRELQVLTDRLLARKEEEEKSTVELPDVVRREQLATTSRAYIIDDIDTDLDVAGGEEEEERRVNIAAFLSQLYNPQPALARSLEHPRTTDVRGTTAAKAATTAARVTGAGGRDDDERKSPRYLDRVYKSAAELYIEKRKGREEQEKGYKEEKISKYIAAWKQDSFPQEETKLSGPSPASPIATCTDNKQQAQDVKTLEQTYPAPAMHKEYQENIVGASKTSQSRPEDASYGGAAWLQYEAKIVEEFGMEGLRKIRAGRQERDGRRNFTVVPSVAHKSTPDPHHNAVEGGRNIISCSPFTTERL
ncbi:hypothetical protein GUITHDRAFT_131628 [Guillardia theta CCMP2712]|uniref:Uncharacterized protein n=1 Tax=Guillardia theta (strain CCMP2712) TaxID=905079 RepID=L1K4Z7_GUITC|nr:hypothetical protein GUITHDRAFT_131628 [Guillardia theta CCMP2712]EKX55428.1 hypothetical protein GUITHDRAFT_131628 [Guillardia theta CCMP2712]|eukprot:XP_005842408.1 hypothetical protein GUITHDRAFT_131628 [Guillardia theta CCMP2712]